MDFSRVCRSCLKVVRSPNLETNLLDMFTYCTRLKISADCILPKKFCRDCSTTIKSAYSFIRIAHQIDHKLKSLLPKVVPSVKVEPDKQTDSIINVSIENDKVFYLDEENKGDEHPIKDDFDTHSDDDFDNDFNNIHDNHNDDKSHIKLDKEKMEVYNKHSEKNFQCDFILSNFDYETDTDLDEEMTDKCEENPKTKKKLNKVKNKTPKKNTIVRKETPKKNTIDKKITPVRKKFTEDAHSDKDLDNNLIIINSDDETDSDSAEKITEKCEENTKTKVKLETLKKNTIFQKRTSLRIKLKEDAQADSNFDNDLILLNFDDKTDTELAEEITEKCKENTETKKKSIKMKNKTPKKNTTVKKRGPACNKLTEPAHSDNNLILFNLDDTTDTELDEEIKKKTSEDKCVENKTARNSLSEEKSVTETPKLNLKYEYSCKICSKKFEKELLLRNHIPNFHPEEDIEGNMVIMWGEEKSEKLEMSERLDDTEYYNSQGKKVHTCNLCNKKFTSLHGYSKHIENQNSGMAKCTCKICHKEFKSPCHLADHVNKAHSDYICNLCVKRFPNQGTLTVHVKTFHIVGRRSTCKICNMKFNNRYELKQHRQSHKVETGHLCHYCGMKFPYERHLQVHLLKHTKEKPHKCPLCPFQTGYICHMRKHESVHKGEKNKLCPHCPKSFIDAGILARHIRCHTGERPYQCPYCERAFIDSWKRRSHMMHAHCLAPENIPRMNKQGNPIS